MNCRLVTISSCPEEFYSLKEGPNTIGRDSDNDIQLISEGVSRHHARIDNMPSVCVVEDLRSTNGTHVSGQRVTKYTLSHGEEIRLGDCLLRFEACRWDDDADTGGFRDYSTRVHSDTIKLTRHPGEETVRQDRISSRPKKIIRPLRPKSAVKKP